MVTGLATLRRERGLSQLALAGHMDVDHTTVSNWERGIQVPTDATQHRLAGVLGVQVAQLGLDGALAEGEVVVKGRGLRLDGVWHAIWETSFDRQRSLDTEVVDLRQGRRDTIVLQNRERAPENPHGGYLWRAECKIYDGQYLMGVYVAREPNVRSKGTIYLALHASGSYFAGRWIGVNYDSEQSTGISVLARDKAVARARMTTMLEGG